MNWKYLDKDLGVRSSNNIKDSAGRLPLYCKSDVDPATPEWQGENVIQLINGDTMGTALV